MIKQFFTQYKFVTIPAIPIFSYLGYKAYSNYKLNSLQDAMIKEIERIKETSGEDDLKIPELQLKLGNISYQKDDCEQAANYYKKPLEQRDQIGNLMSKEISEAYSNLYQCYEKQENKQQESIEAFSNSLLWKFQNYDHNKQEVSLADFRSLLKKLESSQDMSEKLMEILKEILPILTAVRSQGVKGQEEEDFKKLESDILQKLGTCYFLKSEGEYNRDHLQKALSYYEQSMEILNEEQYGNEDKRRQADLHYHNGRTYYALQQLDKAMSECQKTIELYESNNYFNNNKDGEKKDIQYGHCSALLGYDLMYRNEIQKALPFIQSSIGVFRDRVDPKDQLTAPLIVENQSQNNQNNNEFTTIEIAPQIDTEDKFLKVKYGQALVNLGVVYMKTKKIKEAVEVTQKGVNLFEREMGQNTEETLQVKLNLAIALFENQQNNEAINLYLDVQQKAQKLYGQQHPLTQKAFQVKQNYLG